MEAVNEPRREEMELQERGKESRGMLMWPCASPAAC